jgi:hypothetical protein
MGNFDRNSGNLHFSKKEADIESFFELDESQDLLAEEILENMNSTPLGQILKKIACLPEVRQKKVLDLRQQICSGQYDINNRLDATLERMLEEI